MPLECEIIVDGIPEGAISRKVGLIWGIPDKYVYRPRKGMVVAREQGTSPFETPEQVKEAIAALSKEQQDCLRRLLGDGAFAELKSGARLPTQEEVRQAEECPAR